MPTVQQVDFSGGMISRLSPERLPENAYSFGKNIEVRDGTPRTRRGSLRLYCDIAGEAFQGAGIFRSPFRFDKVEALLVAQGGKVYRMAPPLDRVEMALPGLLSEGQVRFVQGIDTMYLFQGEGQQVWEWDGEEDTPWSVVPDPTDGGKNLVGTERVTYAYGRFWMATERDTVEFSDILSTSVPLSQGFNVNHGEGETVNAIFQIGNGELILAKDRSMYVIGGANYFTDASQLTASDALSHDIGVFAQDTIIQPGADTWYLSRDGVYSLSVNREKNTFLVDVPISDLISDRFARINWERAHLAQGIWFDNYYLLAVPVSGGQTNTTIFAYDFLTKAWVSEWELYTGDADEVPTTLFAVSRFIVSTRLGVNRLYAINELGGVMELLKDNLKDNYSSPDRYLDFSATTDAEDNPIEAETTIQRVNAAANLYDGFTDGHLSIDYNLGITPCPLNANGLYRLRNAGADKNLTIEIETDVARNVISSPDTPSAPGITLEIAVGGSNVLTTTNNTGKIYTATPILPVEAGVPDDSFSLGVADPATAVFASAVIHTPVLDPFPHDLTIVVAVGGSTVLTVTNHTGVTYTPTPILSGTAHDLGCNDTANSVYAYATIGQPSSPASFGHNNYIEIEVGGSLVLKIRIDTGLTYTANPLLLGAEQDLGCAGSISYTQLFEALAYLINQLDDVQADAFGSTMVLITALVKETSTYDIVVSGNAVGVGSHYTTQRVDGYTGDPPSATQYFEALAHLLDQLPFVSAVADGGTSVTITANEQVFLTYDIGVSGTAPGGGHFLITEVVGSLGGQVLATQYFAALAYLLNQLNDVSAAADGGTSVTITADQKETSAYDIIVGGTAIENAEGEPTGHFITTPYTGTGSIKATMTQGSIPSWAILTEGRNYRDALWHTISIYHNGTTPVLLIDGSVPPQGLTGAAPIRWLGIFDDASTTEEFNIHRGRDNGFEGKIRRFEVYGPDSKDEFLSDGVTANTKRVCFHFGRTPPSSFPPGYTYNLYDDSDTTQRFQLGGIDLSWGNAFLGGVAPAPANIEATFISRGYGADSIFVDGANPKVEYTVAHANPEITSSLIGSKPFNTQTMIADQTYDKTKYEVNNRSDWDATNADSDHDTFGREDYPPIALGSSDSFVLAEDEEITMGIETRHTHTVTGNIHSPWIRLKLENAQGRFDLIDVILNTEEQPVFTGRGL